MAGSLQDQIEKVKAMLNGGQKAPTAPAPPRKPADRVLFMEAHGREATAEEIRLMRKVRRKLRGENNPYRAVTRAADLAVVEQILAVPVLKAVQKQFEIPKELEQALVEATVAALLESGDAPASPSALWTRTFDLMAGQVNTRGTRIPLRMVPARMDGDGFEDE